MKAHQRGLGHCGARHVEADGRQLMSRRRSFGNSLHAERKWGTGRWLVLERTTVTAVRGSPEEGRWWRKLRLASRPENGGVPARHQATTWKDLCGKGNGVSGSGGRWSEKGSGIYRGNGDDGFRLKRSKRQRL
jgi:hypothetical protein